MRAAAGLALTALAATQLAAQSLANRVDAVRDGRVLLSFSARPGVCGGGRGSVWIHNSRINYTSGDRQTICNDGPVRVAIGRADKQTISVRKWVGGRWNADASDVDLGTVSASDAAHYLLDLAHSLGGTNADDAVSAAAFADARDLSPDLLKLVRDDNASTETRKQALFWLGQSDFPTADLVRMRESLKPFSLREH